MRKFVLFLAVVATAGAVHAQTYPNRPVKVIIPWPPGQATDLAARIVGEKLSQQFGQPFIMENRPGAGGAIGTEIVVKLAAEIQKAVQTADLKERYVALGMDTASNSPDEMMAYMRREQDRYATIIKNAGIKIEQ